MGEPPPISLYFSMMDGVRLLAIKGPSQDCMGGTSRSNSCQPKSKIKRILYRVSQSALEDLGPNSIEKKSTEKSTEKPLEIPYTKKKVKNGEFRHATESK